MIDWNDVKKAELGEPFENIALKNCCKAIYGGVSWPGRRPGFAVVVAMSRKKFPEGHHICLLDEYESFDMRELIRHCGMLDSKYEPYRWFGDTSGCISTRFCRIARCFRYFWRYSHFSRDYSYLLRA